MNGSRDYHNGVRSPDYNRNHTSGPDYANRGQDYGNRGQDYGNRGQDYGNRGQDYGNRGQDYSNRGQDYGNLGNGSFNGGRGFHRREFDRSNSHDVHPGGNDEEPRYGRGDSWNMKHGGNITQSQNMVEDVGQMHSNGNKYYTIDYKRGEQHNQKNYSDGERSDGQYRGKSITPNLSKGTGNERKCDDEKVNGEAHTEETSNGEAHTEETSNGEAHTEETSNGEAHTEETSNGTLRRRATQNERR